MVGCTARNLNGVDATSDGVPVVRNCGAWIRGVRALDADTRRVVWAAHGAVDASSNDHDVGTVTLGRLPGSWAEETPLELSPRPRTWMFEIDVPGRVETLVLEDSEIVSGSVARPLHERVRTSSFYRSTCSGGPSGIAALLIFVFIVVWVGAVVLWIVTIVQVARIPEYQFRAAGTEKTTWILVVVLVQIIGAVIWYLGPRRRVVRAVGAVGPPPGWYATPTGAFKWWDGRVWTEAWYAPPPSGPPISIDRDQE